LKAEPRAESRGSPAASLRVLLMNTKDVAVNPNSYMTLAVAEGLRAHLGHDSVKIVKNRNLVEEALNYSPDALICFDGEQVQFDTVLQVKKMGVPVIGWLTEDPYELPTNLQNQNLYDVVFTNERSAVPKYGEGKAAFLPLGASASQCYYPVRDSWRYDVCIAGTAWPERVNWCLKLRETLPDLAWKFILHRVEEIPKYSFPERLVQTDYRLSIGDICRVFNQSKIVVSLKRLYSGWTPQVGLSPAPRIFETSLAGTAQLVQIVEDDEVGEFFDVGREIETFQSVEQCAEKIADLLKDSARRKEIALKGQERALRNHLYKNRVVSIIEWIGSRKTSARLGSAATVPRRLLVCVHSSTESEVFGGTEVLTEELVNHLKPSWSVFLLAHAEKRGESSWRLMDLNRGRIEEEYVGPTDQAATFIQRDHARFKRILLSKEISLVHFQHLLRFPLELPFGASELGIPYTITWTDYYPVCHKFTLLSHVGTYCHPDQIPIETCDVCLSATHGYAPGSQKARRTILSNVMLNAERVVCLSESQREIIGNVFPEVAEKICVIEPLCGREPPRNAPGEGEPAGPLNVAVTGNFARHKGADTAIHVMHYFRNSPDISFHVLGRIDPEYDTIMDATGLKSASNVHIVGGYKPSRRYSIYDGMHVALFLSIWPEGYPLTIEDLRYAGVPCIVTDIGEIARQIQNGVNGWKVPPRDAGAVISILNSLIENREVLALVREKFKEKAPSKLSYAKRMNDLFEAILPREGMVLTDRMLTVKQVKWLGERIESYPAGGTSWANPSPSPGLREPSLSTLSSAAALPTPREVIRRFRSYVRQRGLMRTIEMAYEWLTK